MLLGRWEFKPTLVPTLAAVIVIPVLVSLGVWQLDRAEEKRGIERDVLAATEKDPLLITAKYQGDISDEVYRPAQVKGHYDGERQYLWDNKTHNGRSGYQVITPFVLEDSQQVIMINRGWIPILGRRDEVPSISVTKEMLRVHGVIKRPSNALQLANRIDQKGQRFPHVVQAFEPAVMASELGLPVMPVLLELSPEDAHGYVREWQPYYGKIGKHIGYAAQWFIMALICVFLYLKLNTKSVSRSFEA